MIKVTVVLLIGLTAALGIKRASAALRHWVLTVSLVCAVLMPALERAVPTWQLPSRITAIWHSDPIAVVIPLRTDRAHSSSAQLGFTSTAAPLVDPAGIANILWMAGTTIALLLLALGWIGVLGSRRAPRPCSRAPGRINATNGELASASGTSSCSRATTARCWQRGDGCDLVSCCPPVRATGRWNVFALCWHTSSRALAGSRTRGRIHPHVADGWWSLWRRRPRREIRHIDGALEHGEARDATRATPTQPTQEAVTQSWFPPSTGVLAMPPGIDERGCGGR